MTSNACSGCHQQRRADAALAFFAAVGGGWKFRWKNVPSQASRSSRFALERAQLLALRSNQKCVPYERRQSDWWREVATAKRSAELGAIVFATPWNLPSAMTETVNGRKQLRYDQYAAWATYLSDFDAFMKNNR